MKPSPTPSQAAHTPGPWSVHHSQDVTGYPAYFIHGFAGEQKRDTAMHAANARLIAAAPDLLKALKELSAMYSHAWDLADGGGLVMLPPSIGRFEDAHEAAMKAIKKATGQ